MSEMDAAIVRRMTSADIERVLRWRNHPDIRRHMFDQREIAIDDHRAWFARKNSDAQCALLIFELDGEPSGFIQLHERKGQNAGEWGFYTAPGTARGTGRLLGKAAIDFAFHLRGWHKVNGLTLVSNERSIRMHLALGFQLEGTFREHHFNGEIYVNVCSFGLLRSDWMSKAVKA